MTDLRAQGPSPSLEEQWRDAVLRHQEAGDQLQTIQYVRLLLAGVSTAQNHRFLRKVAERDKTLRPFRIALLASFSIEFCCDALIAKGLSEGLQIQIYQAGFKTFRQEIFDPASGMYAWNADLVILAVEGEDWVIDAYSHYSPGGESRLNRVEKFKEEFSALLSNFRANSKSPLLIHDFASPNHLLLGIADSSYEMSQARLVWALNDALKEVCSQSPDTFVLTYGALIARVGSANWYDIRMKFYAGLPLSQTAITELTGEYLKYCRALSGKARKCLALDLDNTLWGGILGEDGIEGIQLGPRYPGNVYVEFQRSLLGLKSRGVILAIASKNNLRDVEELFAKHPSMVLKYEDFTSVEVHWESKGESLRRIAERLNIGLEHMAFADDNPAECEHVRMLQPAVTVIQLPARPEQYIDTLFKDGWFDTMFISQEDMKRSELYQQRAQAEAFRGESADIEKFFRDLEMCVTFSAVNERNLARCSQLTQKTNQFNATTRRYSEGEIAARMSDPSWLQLAVSVTDRFGDNGIVGLLLAKVDRETADIDTFLLSCRVIGRTVETAMLAELCRVMAERHVKILSAEIIPTAKNAPVRDVYKRHGFSPGETAGDGRSDWKLDIETSPIEFPAWFRIRLEETGIEN